MTVIDHGIEKDRSPWLVSGFLIATSILTTLWLPPVGAVLFIGTTVYAAKRVRNRFLTVVLVALCAVAVAAAPGVFLSSFSGDGTGPAPVPDRPGVLQRHG